MTEAEMVAIYIMGKRYVVPDALTIMGALEYAGYTLIRGVGCRAAFCGACSTVYRIEGDPKLYIGLACGTQVEPGMHLAQIPFYPADRAQYFPRFGAPGYSWPSRIGGQTSSKLVDPNTRAVIDEPGVPGEMAIKSPGIFPGYYKRPDLTERVFDEDGYFYTGDLFEIAGDGDKLDRYRFVSRSKDIIVRGGFKISPQEIEALVAEDPSVAEAAVVGYPDSRLGEKVCLVLAPRQGETVTLQKIIDHLRQREIAVYKLPEKLVIVKRLPRNPLGKVLTQALKDQIEREGT